MKKVRKFKVFTEQDLVNEKNKNFFGYFIQEITETLNAGYLVFLSMEFLNSSGLNFNDFDIIFSKFRKETDSNILCSYGVFEDLGLGCLMHNFDFFGDEEIERLIVDY